MAKLFFVAMLVVAAAAAVMAAPADVFEPLQEGEETVALEDIQEAENEHLRFRRVTCDLLSAGGFIGDSACAANCLSMGKAGGSCHGGICQCRKTTFKELWDKRFG